MRYPLGLTVEDSPFIRSPQRVQDNNIIFYCAVKEGMVLELMEARDMIEDTEAAVKAADKELGGIQALIVFNCILRTLQLESEGKTESFGRILGYPAVGFSTYGRAIWSHNPNRDYAGVRYQALILLQCVLIAAFDICWGPLCFADS